MSEIETKYMAMQCLSDDIDMEKQILVWWVENYKQIYFLFY